MTEILQKLSLIPGQGMLLLPIAVAGYWIHKRRLWASVLYIACASMILNMYLKCYFKIPLAAHVGEGYAFPSGHYQLAFVLWLWTAYQLRLRWLYVLAPLVLALYGWGVVANGYHEWKDVGAAVLAGSALIGIGMVWEKAHALIVERYPSIKAYRGRNWLLWIILIGLYIKTKDYVAPLYQLSLLGVYSAILGSSMGVFVGMALQLPETNWLASNAYRAIVTKIILGFGVAGGMYFYGLKTLHIDLKTSSEVTIFFFLLGLWVTVGVDWLTHKFCPGQRNYKKNSKTSKN